MIVGRVLVGIIFGVAYGLVLGTITFIQWRLTHDPRYPGPLIPDNNAWGRLAVEFTIITVSFCAGFAGGLVGALEVDKKKGALLGGLIGLIIYLLLIAFGLLTEGTAIVTRPLNYWVKWFLDSLIYFAVFPIGLAVIGLLTAFTTGWLTTIRSKAT
jgi:hypothetical protein